MFTGIVTAIGTVREAADRDGGLDLAIEAPYPGWSRVRASQSMAPA